MFRRHRKWVVGTVPSEASLLAPHSPSRLDEKRGLAEGLIVTGSGSCPGGSAHHHEG